MTAEITAGRDNPMGRRRPRGYAPWRPQAKTIVLLDQVLEIVDLYADYLPLTVRQIFYRLVASYAFEKTERAYSRLGEHLVRARRARMIPFDVIRDDGVVSYSSTWHAGPEAFWDHTGNQIRDYRRDLQVGQSSYIELWCESGGMAPQLARVADEYSVPVYGAGGFVSLTAVRLIAERALERDVPTTLLHVGDFDPSGESIFQALANDAAQFVEADRTILTTKVEAVRVALTGDQVAHYELPTTPPKSADSRSERWQGQTCQLEALAPDLLGEIVRTAIEQRRDLDKLDDEIVIQELDRTDLFGALPRGPA